MASPPDQATSLRQRLRAKWKHAPLIGMISALSTAAAFPALLQLAPLPEGGSLEVVVLSQTLNAFILTSAAALVGVTFAAQAGISELPILDSIWSRRFSDAREKTAKAVVLGVPLGAVGLVLIFLLDLVFASMGVSLVPEVVPEFTFLISGVMLGFQAGFYEEALLRLGLLSFVAWVLKGWRRSLGAANLITALLFGVGHIPTLLLLYPEASSFLIVRTILLNAVMGVIFGYCYIRRGYGSAVSAHFTADFVNYGIIQPLLLA